MHGIAFVVNKVEVEMVSLPARSQRCTEMDHAFPLDLTAKFTFGKPAVINSNRTSLS
jgi:hypothetical protein